MNDMDEDQTPPHGPDDMGAPSPPHGSVPRPLLRRDDDKVFAGVAGGLADYVGIDPAVVRVAFVVLSFFGGIGIPLYLVAWAGIRSPSMAESHAEQWFRGAPNPVALIALAVGFVVLLGVMHDGPGDGVGWGLLLLFAGWLLFRADNRAVSGGATAPHPATEPGAWPASSAWHGPGGTASAVTAAPPRSPAPPRPRSILGRLTVGVVLAAVGTAALLDQLGAIALAPVQYAALAMTITGFGLIVGAWVGRAYGLIALGVLLVPVMAVASIGPFPLQAGIGEHRYRPASVAAVADEYTLGAGQLQLDLSAVTFEGTTTQIDVSVGAGETEIIVGDGVTVAVDGQMRAGRARLFGTTTIGRPFVGDLNRIDEGAGAGRLQLSIDNGVGELTIRRASEER
jgi:phage shock protein PspC (stress-responsive transcriptional regulator)